MITSKRDALNLNQIDAIEQATPPGPYYRDWYEDGDSPDASGVGGSRGPMVESNDVLVDPAVAGEYAIHIAECHSAAIAIFLVEAKKQMPVMSAVIKAQDETIAELRAVIAQAAERKRLKREARIAQRKIDDERFKEMREVETAVRVAGPEIEAIRRECRARIETLTDEQIGTWIEHLIETCVCHRPTWCDDNSLVMYGDED